MKRGVVCLVAAALLFPVSGADARDLDEILRDKGILTEKEAAESKGAKEGQPAAPTVPDWVRKITPFGDIRLRNETFLRDGDPDRVRQRFRLRVGAKVAAHDDVEVGFRVASGDPDDPISNNQSFTDTFTFKDIAISNGYLKVAPAKSLGTSRPYFALMGGKFDVPFYSATKLVFDGDLTPEGLYEAIYPVAAKKGVLRAVQLNFGQWVFQEISNSSDGAIFAFQGVTTLAPSERVAVNFGVTDYLFHKPSTIAAARNGNTALTVTNDVLVEDGTVLGGRKIDPATDGRILALVSDFNLLNAGTDLTLTTGAPRWPVKVFGDYVVNTEAEGGDDMGFHAGASIGSTKEANDLSLVYAYERLETDAVLSTFTDSDFGRDGGTNVKGHVLQLNYVLLKGLQFTTSAFITKPVENVPGRNANTDYRWQVDLIGKF